MSSKTFTVVTTVQDPLTAERLVDILTEAGHDAFAREQGAASSAAFASASPGEWAILVPTDVSEAANTLVRAELEAIEKNADENSKAAEEEALSGESPTAE